MRGLDGGGEAAWAAAHRKSCSPGVRAGRELGEEAPRPHCPAWPGGAGLQAGAQDRHFLSPCWRCGEGRPRTTPRGDPTGPLPSCPPVPYTQDTHSGAHAPSAARPPHHREAREAALLTAASGPGPAAWPASASHSRLPHGRHS